MRVKSSYCNNYRKGNFAFRPLNGKQKSNISQRPLRLCGEDKTGIWFFKSELGAPS
jgi:hypothetical protein